VFILQKLSQTRRFREESAADGGARPEKGCEQGPADMRPDPWPEMNLSEFQKRYFV
jgi:hypothetical protein